MLVISLSSVYLISFKIRSINSYSPLYLVDNTFFRVRFHFNGNMLLMDLFSTSQHEIA